MFKLPRIAAAFGLLAVTALGAPPTASAVSYHSAKIISQSSSGSSQTTMSAGNEAVFCMLTSVLHFGTAGGEKACTLTNTINGWVLTATTRSNNEFVQCAAWCWKQ